MKSGVSLDEPLGTVTTNDRFGLVTVDGADYQIVDIGMRMLQPHELYRAQGFPAGYIIDQDYRGKRYAKDKQVARCGNAVPPPLLRRWCGQIFLKCAQSSGRWRESIT